MRRRECRLWRRLHPGLDGDAAEAAELVKEARREYDAVESFLDPDRSPALAN